MTTERAATHPDARTTRPVRSYVLREGRLTPAQRRALQRHWPRYGIELHEGTFDPATIFGHDTKVVLEIGFGNGEVLEAMAENNPETGFLGVEVWRPGIGSLLRKAAEKNLSNVRVIREDATEVVRRLTGASLDEVLILFPDPWPKTRHHKRRLVQIPFAATLADALRSGGLLHLATDWPSYARTMHAAIRDTDRFKDVSENLDGEAPLRLPSSRFERRARARHRRIFHLFYKAA